MVRRKGGQSDPGGGSLPSPALNDRTLPEWLDSQGEHGPVTVLLMAPAHREGKLPNNPFVIAKSVKEQVGSISAAYRDKDGHLVVKVRCAKKAAKLLRMEELIDGTKVTVTEHARLNQVKCITTCHTVEEMSEEELTEELADQGVIGVHRLGRKGGKSATMVVTFRGTVVPKEIFFGFDRCSTRPYKQSPMQCFRCFGFGHTKARCSAEQELCRNCSKAHAIEKDSDGKTVCTAAASCMHCNGAHSPTSRTCPKYAEEEEINEIRTKEDKSAREARRLFLERKAAATGGSSYAAVTGGGNSDAKQLDNLRKELNETKQGLKKAHNDLAKLKEANDKAEAAIAKATAAEQAQERTKHALVMALEKVAKLKEIIKQNKKSKPSDHAAPAEETREESESEMDVEEEERRKRARQLSSDEQTGDDDDDDDDDDDEDEDDEEEKEKNNEASEEPTRESPKVLKKNDRTKPVAQEDPKPIIKAKPKPQPAKKILKTTGQKDSKPPTNKQRKL